jgi:cation diffusion facilitator family transporter
MDKNLKIASGSILVGAIVLGLKYLAYAWTGSIALYSDAVESIINVVAAIAALIAVWYSAQPAEENHPYGHHKAEYFSAVLEGALIIVAALAIVHEAYGTFLSPRAIQAPLEGLLVNGLASAINAVWCWVLISRGRKLRSPALVADGKHLLSDVISSGGVIFGVALAPAGQFSIQPWRL